jgi:hypothetical protein
MKFCQVIIESHSAVETHWLSSTKQAKAFIKAKAMADASINAKVLEVTIPPGKKNLLAWLNKPVDVVNPVEDNKTEDVSSEVPF